MNTVEVWDDEAHRKWDEWADVAKTDVLLQLDPNLMKQLTWRQIEILFEIAGLFQTFITDIKLNTTQG